MPHLRRITKQQVQVRVFALILQLGEQRRIFSCVHCEIAAVLDAPVDVQFHQGVLTLAIVRVGVHNHYIFVKKDIHR